MRSNNTVSHSGSTGAGYSQATPPFSLSAFSHGNSGRIDTDKLIAFLHEQAGGKSLNESGILEPLKNALQQANVHPFDIAQLYSAIDGKTGSSFESSILSDLVKTTAQSNTQQLQAIFGRDIPPAAFQQMKMDMAQGDFTMPTITSGEKLPPGVHAAYDGASKAILISDRISAAEVASPEYLKRLVSEEFGHHVDNMLRNHYSQVGGDAHLDEGALFARDVTGCKVSAADIVQDGKRDNLEFHNEAGHYYGTKLALNSLGDSLDLSQKDKETLDSWAQIPDELSILDAIAIQTQKVKTLGMGKALDGENHPLVNGKAADIQQLRDSIHTLHSLIGKAMRPEEYRATIKQMMHDVWNAPESQFSRPHKLAILGILTHSFGDSYAHIKVGTERPLSELDGKATASWKGFDHKGNEITLPPWTGTFYGAGEGHLFHGREPDDIKADPTSNNPADKDKVNDNRIRMFQAMTHDLIDTYSSVFKSGNGTADPTQNQAAHNSLNKIMQEQIIPDLEYPRQRNTHVLYRTVNDKIRLPLVEQDTDEMRNATMVILNQAARPELLPQGEDAVALRRQDQSGDKNRAAFYLRDTNQYYPENFAPRDGTWIDSWMNGAAISIGGLEKNITAMDEKENILIGRKPQTLSEHSTTGILKILYKYQALMQPTVDVIVNSGKNE